MLERQHLGDKFFFAILGVDKRRDILAKSGSFSAVSVCAIEFCNYIVESFGFNFFCSGSPKNYPNP